MKPEVSYSYEGEDRIVLSLLRTELAKDKGGLFYIDIGCNDPISLSNTYLFYTMGFRGICIDPLPGLSDKYKLERPRDLFYDCAIGLNSKNAEMVVYANEEASSIDPTTITNYNKKFQICKRIPVEVRTLESLVENNVGICSSPIPFVSIDAEGCDLNVFSQVLDLRNTPLCICIENKLVNLSEDPRSNSINKLGLDNGYALIAKTPLNTIFIKKDSEAFSWIPQRMLSC